MHTLLIYLFLLTATHNNVHAQTSNQQPQPLINQFETVNPTDMNPEDYKDKIENTIYQTGDRLIIIQSIPMKYIKEAIEPNIQPTISDYPAF